MSLLPLDCACQGLQQNSLDVCSSETCCKQSQHLYILEYVEQKQQQQQQQQPQPQPQPPQQPQQPQQPQHPQQQPRRFKLPDLSVQLRDLNLVMIEIYKVSS
jgi:hypothetical protein